MTTPRRQCAARSKQSGVQCRRYPTPGSPVCVIHGSRAPQTRRKAAERLAEADALKLLRAMDITPVSDPLSALEQLAGEVVAWKEILGRKVAELSGDYRYQLPAGEQLRAEVLLFERAMDRCVTTLAAISKLNIDERLARVRELEATILEKAMNTALAKIGLDDAQQRNARTIIATEIRTISIS